MSRTLDDMLARWRWPVFGSASVAAGWLADLTLVPADAQVWVAAALSVACFALVVAGTYLHYGELRPGRCRAVTTDGERCSRTAHLGGDCCWQHARLHGVELVTAE